MDLEEWIYYGGIVSVEKWLVWKKFFGFRKCFSFNFLILDFKLNGWDSYLFSLFI